MSEPAKIDIRPFVNVLKGKPASTMKIMEWVGNNLEIPLSEIGPEDPPSLLALSLLQWAQKNRDAFFTQFLVKTIPSKAQLDLQGQAVDDDGRVLGLLNRLEAEIREKVTDAAA